MLTLLTLLALAALALGACAPAMPPEEPSGPEIPSRDEVAEIARLQRPASKASIAALDAYHDRVCHHRAASIWQDGPRPQRRGCFGPGPVQELTMLQSLRDKNPNAHDTPRILERMIWVWGDIEHAANDECARYQAPRAPKAKDIVQAQRSLYSIERMYEGTRSEPLRLCAELHSRYPHYELHVPCPPPEPETPNEETPSGWL